MGGRGQGAGVPAREPDPFESVTMTATDSTTETKELWVQLTPMLLLGIVAGVAVVLGEAEIAFGAVSALAGLAGTKAVKR